MFRSVFNKHFVFITKGKVLKSRVDFDVANTRVWISKSYDPFFTARISNQNNDVAQLEESIKIVGLLKSTNALVLFMAVHLKQLT